MSDDLKNRATKAGEAIGDLATHGLKQGAALAEQAGSVLGGLFGKAREAVESVIPGGDEEALTALKELVRAQEAMTTAISLSDSEGIAASRAPLAAAWAKAREVVAKA